MIVGKETNKVYFSDKLRTDPRSASCCAALTALLNKHAISYGFLEASRDIWARDYMPLQIDTKHFVQFRYEPSYLKGSPELQTDPKAVCQAHGIKPVYSDINLDGGNVVNWVDKALVSERVFSENPKYSNKSRLIADLEKLLEAEVVIIPEIRSDMTGHADGMLRFVDRNTVLGNNRQQEYKYWTKAMNKVLQEHGIEYIDIPFVEYRLPNYPDHAIGCYVNYLEVDNLLVLPIFETKGNKDREVYDQFCAIFPDRKIETLNYNEVGLHGGLLNCTTWTIKVA